MFCLYNFDLVLIDFYWYKTYPTYQSDWNIENDKKLFSLKNLEKKYHINFQYNLLKEGKWYRYYNGIRKRVYSLLQNPASHTIGMRTGFCKLEILALLNEINEEISKDYGKVIKLQINSIIRTQQHQQHLVNLGYTAAKISSHPTGYAVDIERSWYLLHNKKLFLMVEKVLTNYQQKNIINLIDEGIIWHICLNPSYIQTYQSKINSWKKLK